jgi:RNA polymerase sigma-70 factor (ECF subfamily)
MCNIITFTCDYQYRRGCVGFTIEADQVPGKDVIFNEIIKKYHGPVFKHAVRLLGNVSLAQEVTQDVFLGVYHGLDGLREEDRLAAWIHRITDNKCYSLRRKASLNFVSFDETEGGEEIVDECSNPEEMHIQRDTRIEMAGFISQLPQKEAVATTLFFYEGKSLQEIANIMQLPPGTVAVVLHRGKLHLHKLIVNREKEESQQ